MELHPTSVRKKKTTVHFTEKILPRETKNKKFYIDTNISCQSTLVTLGSKKYFSYLTGRTHEINNQHVGSTRPSYEYRAPLVNL